MSGSGSGRRSAGDRRLYATVGSARRFSPPSPSYRAARLQRYARQNFGLFTCLLLFYDCGRPSNQPLLETNAQDWSALTCEVKRSDAILPHRRSVLSV
ncbi:hypothetical protein CHARACLAT_003652 [Characodon lateralis]|uniref:Uncharacterized protein n=1 Tax=Characodon lateralis TaxID=208331 RepID=A0ABU7DXH1_9TELE|nr:hypothetical protein [Characodon lateralis]